MDYRMTHTQILLLQGAALGLLVGIILWFALLIQGASIIQASMAAGETYHIGVGAFSLSDISKQYIEDDTYRLVLHVRPGLAFYIVISTLAGAVYLLLEKRGRYLRYWSQETSRLVQRFWAKVQKRVRRNRS